MTIPTLTSLPVAPARTDTPAVFVTRADAFLAAIVTFQGEMNTSITAMNTDIAGVNANAVTASNAATAAAASAAAAQSASNATAWVSGQTYAAGATVYSLINYKSYRAITGTSGTTDPSASADWTALGYGLPSQSGNADKFLQTNGTTESWQDVPASGGAYTATASGTIASGDKIIINTNGTISSVTGSEILESVSAYNDAGSGSSPNIVWDSYNQKVCVFYQLSNGYGALRAGTISGTTITWGNEVTYSSGNIAHTHFAACYVPATTESSALNRIYAFFRENSGPGYGMIVDLAVFNPSVTIMGSAWASNVIDMIAIYDPLNLRVMLYWQNNGGTHQLCSVTGNHSAMSFAGGYYNLDNSSSTQYVSMCYDSVKQKFLAVYSSGTNSGYLTARSWTVASNGGITISGSVALNSLTTAHIECATYTDKAVNIVYGVASGSDFLYTVDLTNTTPVASNLTQLNPQPITNYVQSMEYDPYTKNVVMAFQNTYNAVQFFVINFNGTSLTNTVSNTIATSSYFETGGLAFHTISNKFMLVYRSSANTSRVVFLTLGQTITNLSQTNWIGVSNAAYSNGVSAEIKTRGSIITNSTFKDIGTILGAAATADTAASVTNAISYDSNSDRYLAVYRHGANNYGTCVVIQVDSSNNLTFGTPTTFASFIVKPNLDVAFDSNVNKFVIAYANNTPQSLARIAIINPSNNSVTFGTEASVTTETSIEHAISFDSNVNKFLICYGRYSPAGGNAKVATINSSANTLSFGAEATFDSSARARYSRSAFDSNINKIIISFIPQSTANGSAIVATINASANTVSFGSASIFASDASVNSSRFPQITYDSTSTKSVISYEDTSATNNARVATINSSTSAVTYGTEASIDSTANAASYQNIVAISGSKVLICYERGGNGNYKIATISGTSLLVGVEVQFVSGSAYYFAPFYNPTNDKVVFNYTIGSTTGGVATSFSRNLSAGTSYLIDFDGTITTTANDFTVAMGTALSTTSVFTKGI